MPAPATSSRHLYTGHHRGHIQPTPRLRTHRSEPSSRDHPTDPSLDAIIVSFRCVSSGSHMFVFSSHTRPAHRETSTAALTTPAPDRRSLRWFGISACTATPQDPPPSLAQHRSCRRSSTSSSLPFRTHVGAHNSVVGADQGFRAPSGDQESVRDSVHEDSASARQANDHGRVSGTHRTPGVDAFGSSRWLASAWGRRGRGLLLVAVLAPVLGAEGYGVGVLVEDCADEREDDDVGGCERA